MEITWASLWRILGMLILVGIFYYALDIWLAVLLALVISSALDPIVSWLEEKRVPRLIGGIGVFFIFILILALILYTVVPIALGELNILIKSIGKVGIPALGLNEVAKLINIINQGLSNVVDILSSGSISFLNLISRFMGGIMLVGSVFVLSFYLTIDRDGVEKFLRAVLPAGYEEEVLDVYFRTRKKIGRWFFGQALVSLSIGFVAFIGLLLIGVKYSLVLGIITGLAEIVPFVGPIVSGSLAFLIAAPESFTLGMYVFLLYVFIHYLESWVLAPYFIKMTTSLHPAAILVSLLLGARLFGFIGIILAVPLTVMVYELIDRWSTEKIKRRVAGQVS